MLACLTRLDHRTIVLPVLIVVFSLLLNACSKSSQQNNAGTSTVSAASLIEPSPDPATRPGAPLPTASTQPNETSQPAPVRATATQPAATLAEAQAAVSRIYRTALSVNTNHSGSPFLVGDFNNDGSQDIAVIVKPAKGTLQTLNDPYSPWIVEDLSKIDLSVDRNGVRVLPPKPGPVKIEENDELLAIVHGYQQSGWRNPQAQQTYLLRHAVGDSLEMQPLKNVVTDATKQSSHSRVGGDVIKQKVAGQEGFVYWTGAKYAWFRKK